MIINTMAYLVIIGLLGLLRLRMRYDRFISWIMFLGIAFLFFDYSEHALTASNPGFSFLWNSSKIGDITIDFRLLNSNSQLIVPIFFMSLITILNNNIFRYEEKKTPFNALIILNFVSLSLLICSENYVQLITTVFVSDILGYLLIKDVDSSHRYVVYNFFADMCLFMILALARGRIQSLDIRELFSYDQIGRHKDFVSLVTAVALFIKMGLFPFQSYLLDLSAARFQRMSAINLLFSPLSGLLVLLKLHNLLAVSDLSVPLLNIISVLAFLCGIAGFVLKNNIQKKLVYFNMALLGLLLVMLLHNNFGWKRQFAYYYIAAYFFNFIFFKIYLYQNREKEVSEMLNSREVNSKLLKATLLQMVLLANIFAGIVFTVSRQLEQPWMLAGGAIILLSLAVILNHIYKSPHTRRLDYLKPNPLRAWSFIFNTSLLLYASWYLKACTIYNIVFVLAFLACISLPFLTRLRAVYANKWLQHEDLGNRFFFYTLVTPFMYLSRTLWLMVDFVFSERMITSMFAALNRGGISLFFRLNRKSYTACFIFILIGILAFVLSFYWRNLP